MHVAPFCAGCGLGIFDQYFLCVCPPDGNSNGRDAHEQGQAWHCRCLTCSVCGATLDPAAASAGASDDDTENSSIRARMTCYFRDGHLLCRDDYYRRIGENGTPKRCTVCKCPVSKDEMVMKIREFIYHLSCFRCCVCCEILQTGDHFGLRDHGMVCCQRHYINPPVTYDTMQMSIADSEASLPSQALLDIDLHMSAQSKGHQNRENEVLMAQQQIPDYAAGAGGKKRTKGKGKQRKRKNSTLYDRDTVITSQPSSNIQSSPESSPSQLDGESMSPLGLGHSGDITLGMHMAHGHLRMRRDSCSPNSGGPSHQGQQRTKRMRTSFKHQQLRAMKQYFGINHNPDAKDLKQLAQKTGLTKRVLQVWFQNARAKYRRSLLKQEGASGRLSSCGTESESPLRSERSPCNSSRLDSGRCQEDHSPCSCSSSYVSPVGDHLAKDAASENPASGHYTDALPHSDYY